MKQYFKVNLGVMLLKHILGWVALLIFFVYDKLLGLTANEDKFSVRV